MRGEVYRIDLSDAAGSEPAGRRPAVVVQADSANRSSSTTIVAAISAQIPSKSFPMHVRVPDGVLPKPSVVKCEQLQMIDIDHRIPDAWKGPVATLDATTMREIDRALTAILGWD